MSTLRFLAVLLAVAPGCIVYADGSGPPPSANITYADAGCYWDSGYLDYVVYFDVDVADGENGRTVEAVFADVYDDVNNQWVDGFELYPEGGVTWFSAWVGSSTFVDCRYPHYIVDITAQTYGGDVEIATVPLVHY